MAQPETTAAVAGEEQPRSGVQMALVQLITEQNRLLQQLVESESADPRLELLPEPGSRQKKWESEDLLPQWHDGEEDRATAARKVFEYMEMLLQLFRGEDSLNPDDHRESVLEQLHRLRKDLSPPSWRALTRTMNLSRQSPLFSLCNSTRYDHPSAVEEQSTIGFFWFVLSISLE